MNLDRRQLLTYAIDLIGGSVAVPGFGAIAQGTVKTAYESYDCEPVIFSPYPQLLDDK